MSHARRGAGRWRHAFSHHLGGRDEPHAGVLVGVLLGAQLLQDLIHLQTMHQGSSHWSASHVAQLHHVCIAPCRAILTDHCGILYTIHHSRLGMHALPPCSRSTQKTPELPMCTSRPLYAWNQPISHSNWSCLRIEWSTVEAVSRTAPQKRSPLSGRRLVVPTVMSRTGAWRDTGSITM